MTLGGRFLALVSRPPLEPAVLAYGKRAVGPREDAEKAMLTGKFWRRHYTVVIADQVTGLPLAWTVHGASMDEARAIVPLPSLLFLPAARHVPAIPGAGRR